MNIFKPIKDESGIALVIALVMLLALTVIGISSMMTSTLDVQISGNERRAAEALNIADTGIERALHDFLYDFKRQSPNSFTANNTLRTLNLVNSGTVDYALGTPLNGIFAGGEPASGQWGDPFASADLAGPIANATDLYGVQDLGDGKYRVLVLRDSSKPNEIYARSYAEHKTGARKIIQLHLGMNTVDVWRNAIFAGRGSASASITGNINVAGSVHVLGTGAQNNYSISGHAGVYNGYKGLGGQGGDANFSPAQLLGRIVYDDNGDGVYDNLKKVGTYSGNNVYSLEAEFRAKNVQVQISGSGDIGEPGAVDMDSDADTKNDSTLYGNTYWKSQMDGIYANNQIIGSNYYADNVADPCSPACPRPVESYDLGDKIQMPAFNDSYTDPNGTDWPTYKEYIESESLTIPNTIACSISSSVPSFTLGVYNASGVCVDPKGCITWNPTTSKLDIQGRVQFDRDTDGAGPDTGCAQEKIVIGTAKQTITYTGKGLIYSDKNMQIKGSLVTSTANMADGKAANFVVDHLMGVLTTGNLQIAEGGAGGDSHPVVMGAFFAGGIMATEMPSQIIGSVVSNEFCLGGTNAGPPLTCQSGGTASDIFYVPYLSDEISKLGMIKGNTLYTFANYDWDEKW